MRDIIVPAKKLVNSLIYCDVCSPVVTLGWGGIPFTPKHYNPVTKNTHDCKVIEIGSDEKPNLGESQPDFLARMAQKYI